MQLKHERKMYPPRVKLTIHWRNPDDVFPMPIRFIGCSVDGRLDVNIKIPIGKH